MRGARALLCLLAAATLCGCSWIQRYAWELDIPGTSAPFRVERVVERASYLDVTLSSRHIERRIFADASDAVCLEMLVEGEEIWWGASEPFGPLARGDARCSVSGIGNLEQWREARARRIPGANAITRTTERYRIVYRGEDFVLARGGFSMGALLGWSPGSDHALALIGREPPCDLAAEDGFYTLEFRPSGSVALGILTPQGLCRVQGLIAAPRLWSPRRVP